MFFPGATQSEYRVYNVKCRSQQGVYMCLVSNEQQGKVISKGAVLQIGNIPNKHHYFGEGLQTCLLKAEF